MKTLYIVRHAKSSWDDPNKPDVDRPLNERGKRDAPRMGKRLAEKNILPDLLVTSPAKRTMSTCKRIAEQLGYKKKKIKTIERLYLASEDEMLSVVKKLKDKHKSVMIFGHNPGLTDFVNSLMDESIDIENIPTCGMVAFQLDIKSWSEIKWGRGKFLFFDYPKSKED